MTKEQAYEKLELPVGTDLQVVRQKFQQMHNDFQVQIDGAFNEAMRKRKEEQLEELKEAFAVLNESESMDDSASLPRTEKTFDQTGGDAKKQSTQQQSARNEQQQAPPPPPPGGNQRRGEQSPPIYNTSAEKKKSKAGLFIGIAVAVIVVLAGFYFLSGRGDNPGRSMVTTDPYQDSNAWEAALAGGNEAAYTHYIKQHPKGIFMDAAIDSLTRLKGADFAATVVEEAQKQVPANTLTSDAAKAETKTTSSSVQTTQSNQQEKNNTNTSKLTEQQAHIEQLEQRSKEQHSQQNSAVIIQQTDSPQSVSKGNQSKSQSDAPVISPNWRDQYDYIADFKEGIAVVSLNEKYGYVDQQGNVIVSPKYDIAWKFDEGLSGVKLNGKWGYLDKEGNEVAPIKYDGLAGFNGGLSVVVLNGKYGYIDKKGNVVIPIKYDYASNFPSSDGGDGAEVRLNGRAFIINKQGICISNCPD